MDEALVSGTQSFLTALLTLGGVVAVHRKMMNMEFPENPIKVWLERRRTQKLMHKISVMVLLAGDRIDGPLKGQIPSWLVPHKMVNRGRGTVQVLVSTKTGYHIMHFQVDRWTPRYGEIEPYSQENAHKLMEIHLKGLGHRKPLSTVY